MSDYKVNRQRWDRMSIFEQMGNIYSEVGRALKAKRANDKESCELATFRALDLFDATTESLLRQKSPRLKEVLRAKDQFLSAVYGQMDDQDLDKLDSYFFHYSLAARLRR